jgi:HAD superfamily hydrolase (TIGR01509 family)
MIDLSKFDAVIFDFDGVLADSETMQCGAWRMVAVEAGIRDLKLDVAQIAGKQDIHIAPELFPVPLDCEKLMRRKWEVEDEMEARGLMKPVESAIELLVQLSKTHTLGIASSRWQEKIERWLRARELFDLFPVIVGKCVGYPCKPDPSPYLRAMEKLGVKAEQACAVEDSETGIIAAKAAGMYAIQLVHPYMKKCEKADGHVMSLREILSTGWKPVLQ